MLFPLLATTSFQVLTRRYTRPGEEHPQASTSDWQQIIGEVPGSEIERQAGRAGLGAGGGGPGQRDFGHTQWAGLWAWSLSWAVELWVHTGHQSGSSGMVLGGKILGQQSGPARGTPGSPGRRGLSA